MKHTLTLLSLSLFSLGMAHAQNTARFHQKAIVVDTHGDILSDQIRSGIDIGQLQQGGQFDLVRAR